MKPVIFLLIGAAFGSLLIWDAIERRVRIARPDEIAPEQLDLGAPGILSDEDAARALAEYASRIRARATNKDSIPIFRAYWDAANIHLWAKKLHGDDIYFVDKRLDRFLLRLGRSGGKHYFVSDQNRNSKRHQNLARYGWTIHYKMRDMTFAGGLAEGGGIVGGIASFFSHVFGLKPFYANVDDELIQEMRKSASASNVVVLLSGDSGFADALDQLPETTVKVVVAGRESLSRVLHRSSDEFLNANLFLARRSA